MKKIRRQAFALMYVIVAMSLVSMALFALTCITKNVSGNTNMMYLDACRRNLLLSGLAWTKHNPDDINKKTTSEIFDLDISKLEIPAGTVKVTVTKMDDSNLTVRLNASCAKGGMSRRCEFTTKLPVVHDEKPLKQTPALK